MTTNTDELRELHDDELETRLREAKEELFNLRFQVATGQLDNNRRLQTVRRDIARIYTVMRQRELGIRATPAPVEVVPAAAAPKKTRKAKAADVEETEAPEAEAEVSPTTTEEAK